ncbi:MAG TPA: hypothetical protein VF142_21190, partial [Longimicrobium sp.]
SVRALPQDDGAGRVGQRVSTHPPVLPAAAVVERLARRDTSLAAQVLAGTAAGLAGYVAAAFVACAVYVTVG